MLGRIWSFTTVVPALLLSLFLQGCDSGGNTTGFEGSSTVTLSVNGLEKIVGGLNYEAWLVVGDANNYYGYPLVLFNIDESGRMVDPANDTILTGPYQADVRTSAVLGVAVSLEVTNVLREFSSSTFILGGELIQGTATLTADDWIALNRDLSGIAGTFALSTPTDEDPGNELSGVWFINPSENSVEPGLTLPVAPSGWNYEGWVEVDGHVFSTGKFLYPNEPDSAATYSGTADIPLYPGEDFLFNAPAGVDFPLDLSGGLVYVTFEPWEEWDVFKDAPFFLRILQGQIPAIPNSLTPYGMTSLVGQLPSGTATVQDL